MPAVDDINSLTRAQVSAPGVRPPGRLPALGAAVERWLLTGWGARLRGVAWQAAFVALAAILAAFLSYKAVSNQITETNLLHEDRVSLAAYLDGTVNRPFAFRVLTPVLVNAAQAAGVPALLRALPGPLAAKLPQWCELATSVPRPGCDSVAAYVAVAGVFCFGFLMLVYATCLRLFAGNPLIAVLGLLFAFFGVNAVLLLDLSHLYDFGTLLFATALLLCLECGWTIAFTVLLPLAFLTKETLVLYGCAFFLVNLGRIGFARNLALCLVQLASFAVLFGLLLLHFRDNPGGHEYYLPDQVGFFTEQVTLLRLLLMTFAVVLTFYGFRNKSPALRRACIVLLPWFAAAMVGGLKKELRVIFEVLPLILLLGMDSLVQLVLGGPRDAGRASG